MPEIELKQPVVVNDETDKTEEFYDLSKENSSVYTCALPPSTLEGWAEKLEKDCKTFEHLFVNKRECELFCKLPLDHQQRLHVLKTMIAEKESAKMNKNK
jgi:hypothetical protein